MAEARLDSQWDHTASVMAMLRNCHSDSRSAKASPAEYHPMRIAERKRTPLPKMKMSDLAGVLGAKEAVKK